MANNNTTPLQDLDAWVAQWELVHGFQIPTDHLLEKISTMMRKERDIILDAYFNGFSDGKVDARGAFPGYFRDEYPAHPTIGQEPTK